MNRSTTTAAILLTMIASPVLAQRGPEPVESVTVTLTHDDADGILQVGETATWSLQIAHEGIEPDNGDGIVSINSIRTSIEASNAGLASSDSFEFSAIGIPNWNSGYGGGLGDANGGIDPLYFGNSLFVWYIDGDPKLDRRNPLEVGTFETTALAIGQLTYTLQQNPATNYFVGIDDNIYSTIYFQTEDVVFNIDTLTIIPAPPSGLLLVPGALLGVRRGRR